MAREWDTASSIGGPSIGSGKHHYKCQQGIEQMTFLLFEETSLTFLARCFGEWHTRTFHNLVLLMEFLGSMDKQDTWQVRNRTAAIIETCNTFVLRKFLL